MSLPIILISSFTVGVILFLVSNIKKSPSDKSPTIGPAISNENKHCFVKFHREDGHTIENPNGTKVKTNSNGDRFWSNSEGKFHRIDGPAIEHANGDKEWYRDGILYRENGPSIEFHDGVKVWSEPKETPILCSGRLEWRLHKKLHRTDGPAVEFDNGNREWWINGLRHRVDGPAVEYANGNREWWSNNRLHRIGGPAIEHNVGLKEWYIDGLRHRANGPAVEHANGNREWWIKGCCTKKESSKTTNVIPVYPENFASLNSGKTRFFRIIKNCDGNFFNTRVQHYGDFPTQCGMHNEDKQCPICFYYEDKKRQLNGVTSWKRTGVQDRQLKNIQKIKPTERFYFNVIDLDSKDHSVKILSVSNYFKERITSALNAHDPYVDITVSKFDHTIDVSRTDRYKDVEVIYKPWDFEKLSDSWKKDLNLVVANIDKNFICGKT